MSDRQVDNLLPAEEHEVQRVAYGFELHRGPGFARDDKYSFQLNDVIEPDQF
jgi:hypothetical protein